MNILGLSENIFRNIFDFLEYNEVYFKLRKVCRQFKIYVDGYSQIYATFMLLEGNIAFPWGSGLAWILCFKQRRGEAFFDWIKVNHFEMCRKYKTNYKPFKVHYETEIF